MARIAGVEIPPNKPIRIGLRYIFGIGNRSSVNVLSEAGIAETVRARELSESQVAQLNELIGEDNSTARAR